MRMGMTAVLALVACSGSKEDPPPVQETPAPPPVAEPPAREAPPPAEPSPAPPRPAGGVAAVASVPRKHWPCRFVNAIDGTTIAQRWEYGARTQCSIPPDLAGSRGIVGCPERGVQQNLENQVELPERYAYDDAGHLVGVTTIATTFRYEWNGDLVVARTIGTKRAAFAAQGPVVTIRDQNDETETIELDKHGRVTRYARGGSETQTYGWKGARLVELDAIGTTRIEYDCKRPPRR